jgi:hypothetical protein
MERLVFVAGVYFVESIFQFFRVGSRHRHGEVHGHRHPKFPLMAWQEKCARRPASTASNLVLKRSTI